MSNSNIPESCYAKIEGDWKDFRFRRILPADHEAVKEHISQHFLRDEPTSKLLGWSEDFASDMGLVVDAFLQHGMSFLAEHRQSRKIAAVRITFHHVEGVDITQGQVPSSRQARVLLGFVHDIEAQADFPGKYGIDNWAEFFAVSTDPEFRNQGLAGELYERSMKFLKSAGFKHALVLVTSPYTKQATKKRGFTEIARMDYDQIRDPEGKPAFKAEDLNEDHFGLVMITEL